MDSLTSSQVNQVELADLDLLRRIVINVLAIAEHLLLLLLNGGHLLDDDDEDGV